ncbi:MAG: PEGA domain-containing protein [Myxococcota bacterium]
MRATALVLGVTLMAALPSDGRADTAQAARFFFERGADALAAGRYGVALELMIKYAELSSSATAQYNVGRTATLAGESELAFVYYRRYLASAAPDAVLREGVERELGRLERELALVEVRVPPEARLYIDERGQGVVAEAGAGDDVQTLVVPAAPGEHRLLVEAPSFLPFEQRVRTAPGERVVVAAAGQMERRRAPFVVRLRAVPEDARPSVSLVGMDGEAVPLTAGAETSLPVGRYRLEVAGPGIEPEEREVILAEAGSSLLLTLRAAALPAGRLLVTGPVRGADVFVDGAMVGVTPLLLPEVDVGAHLVRVGEDEQSVSVEAERGTLVTFADRPQAP